MHLKHDVAVEPESVFLYPENELTLFYTYANKQSPDEVSKKHKLSINYSATKKTLSL